MRKRRHPLIPLVLWLAGGLLASLAALVMVIASMHASEAELDSAHLKGMELGQRMCGGLR